MTVPHIYFEFAGRIEGVATRLIEAADPSLTTQRSGIPHEATPGPNSRTPIQLKSKNGPLPMMTRVPPSFYTICLGSMPLAVEFDCRRSPSPR